jgi:hypothetical protein
VPPKESLGNSHVAVPVVRVTGNILWVRVETCVAVRTALGTTFLRRYLSADPSGDNAASGVPLQPSSIENGGRCGKTESTARLRFCYLPDAMASSYLPAVRSPGGPRITFLGSAGRGSPLSSFCCSSTATLSSSDAVRRETCLTKWKCRASQDAQRKMSTASSEAVALATICRDRALRPSADPPERSSQA